MDFGTLPPEINSARIYSGPGAGSLLAAAAAWHRLAAGLYSVAESYRSVISWLPAGPWLGPSSALMVAACAPYVAWLSRTATVAEQAAVQATKAASAYDAAFAMTVPPQQVEANRSLLMTLIAADIFGLNTAAIAATEAAYEEMWDQDAAAMYGYAGAAAAASTLTPFEEAPEITSAVGLADQAVVVAKATGVAAATRLMNNVPQALQGFAAPTQYITPPGKLQAFLQTISPFGDLVSVLDNHISMEDTLLSMTDTVSSMLASLFPAAGGLEDATLGLAETVGGEAGALGQAVGGELVSVGGALGPESSAVAAGLGRAPSVGMLSVPQSWPGANQAILPVARAVPVNSLIGVPQGAPEHVLGGLPGGHLGTGAGPTVSNVLRVAPRAYVMPRTPAAG